MPVGPNPEWMERLTSERLELFLRQDAHTMQSVRPPIPNIGKVRPRFGYTRRNPTIEDVVRVNEVYPESDQLIQRPGYLGSALPGWSTA